jgi:hypothetical protein
MQQVRCHAPGPRPMAHVIRSRAVPCTRPLALVIRCNACSWNPFSAAPSCADMGLSAQTSDKPLANSMPAAAAAKGLAGAARGANAGDRATAVLAVHQIAARNLERPGTTRYPSQSAASQQRPVCCSHDCSQVPLDTSLTHALHAVHASVRWGVVLSAPCCMPGATQAAKGLRSC